MTNLLQFVD